MSERQVDSPADDLPRGRQGGDRGAGAGAGAGRFDALDAAAVAMLEPGVLPVPAWRERIAEALLVLEREAGRAGFTPLATAAGLFHAQLSVDGEARVDGEAQVDGNIASRGDSDGKGHGDGDAELRSDGDEVRAFEDVAQRAAAAAWAADLLDLCTGRLELEQAQALAPGDPGLAGQLLQLATRIDALRGPPRRSVAAAPVAPTASVVPVVPAAPAVRAAPAPGGPVDFTASGRGDGSASPAAAKGRDPNVVARDELEMLADEASAMLDELVQSDDGVADPAADSLALADGLGRIAQAAALIGLPALASLLEARVDDLGLRAQLSAEDCAALDATLAILPDALARSFRSAGADRSMLGLLAAAGWPSELAPARIAAAEAELASLRLVDSRQIELPSELAGRPDLSLAIPVDVDRSVVDSLLGELPELSSQLSERIAALANGRREDVIAAQRLAHTLKGSANTVGVRGIAAITHRLEDLLQLLARRPEEAPEQLLALLDDAADCVADMCEAVAGLAPAPVGAAAVYERILGWIGLLIGEPAPQASGRADEQDGASGIPVAATAERLADLAGDESPGRELRVPAALVEHLLELLDEAAILVANAQEQALGLERSRATMRLGDDRLQDLAGELEQLVDIRGLALDDARARQVFDSLELDEYNDLHMVSRRIAESGADGKLVERQLGTNLAGLRDSLAHLERVQAVLRDGVLSTRMAEFASIIPRLQRVVRQAARMAGCEARLLIEGEDTPVEAAMLSTLAEALGHLLRNAVDHGIETPQRRVARGAPATGTIRLQVSRAAGSLSVVCEDDGRGFDPAVIRERAIALGLLAEGAGEIDDPQALQALLLLPGFSTREHATQLSGRGIGLDAVRQAVEGLRGTIAIDSKPDRGTRFVLKLPVGLASQPVMLMRSAGYALALSVRGIERIVPVAGLPAVLEVDGVAWTTLSIESLFGLPPDGVAGDDGRGLSTIVESTIVENAIAGNAARSRSALLLRAADGTRTALVVAEPAAPRNIVVRPLPAHVPRLPGIDGIAVFGDGVVAPVIDLGNLLAAHADGSLGARAARAPVRIARPSAVPFCLVVDDSVSVRRTTEIFMRDLGFEVEGAVDGLEALERARRRTPDLLLVDLEMPRMNGVELVRALRAVPDTAAVPVIMITSRYSERHKQLALEAGVDVFLTKPYTEDALASEIQACLARRPPIGLSHVSRMG